MTAFGYALSSEEHDPQALVKLAGRAEQAGFTFASISDHFHPWITRQGNSPLVWSVIGGIASTTSTLELQTGVTCPIMRIHPAIIAQASATSAAMMPGRFRLGLGAGENLNEHITGEHWPPAPVRQEMLEEAIEIIRELWKGEETSYYGNYFTVEEAKLFNVPPEAPPIYVAASGPRAAELAARNDGLITTSPSKEVVQAFDMSGGRSKPKYGQVTVCWAETEAQGRKTAHEIWPTSAIPGDSNWETKTVELFDQLASGVTEDQVAKSIVCGPDPQKHLAEIQKYLDAGFTHVYFHQVGEDQEGFFRFYEKEILPQLARRAGASAAG